MKILLAMLMCVPMLCASIPTGAAESPPPERAAGCIKRIKDAVGCFTGQTAYRVMLCKLKIQLGETEGCFTNGEHDLADYYEATLKRFSKNKAAQSMTKDYYAQWRSTMSAIVTRSPEASRMEADLRQKSERLELEK